MNKKNISRVVMGILRCVHFAVTVALFLFAWMHFIGDGYTFKPKYNWFTVILYVGIVFYLHKVYDAYHVSYLKPKKLIFAQSLSNLIGVVLVFVAVTIVWNRWHNPIAFIYLLVAQSLFNVFWSYLADSIYFYYHSPARTYIVYQNADELVRLDEVRKYVRKFSIMGEVCAKGETIETVLSKIADAEALFVLEVDATIRTRLAAYCLEKKIKSFFIPQLKDIIYSSAQDLQSFGTPLVSVRRTDPDPIYMIVKRVIDFVLALVGLILASPLMLFAAIAIKVKDPGPVFFTQERIGRSGKTFICYKFRTMSVKAPIMHPNAMSNAKSYLSPLGSYLRSSSIDELPQLFNILRGDMAFIGPRPIPLYEEELIKNRMLLGVYNLRPGLSGLAQVSGRNNVNDTEKLIFDYEYLLKVSLVLDIRIFFQTIYMVLIRRGIFNR